MSGDAKASENEGEVQAGVSVVIAEEQQSSEPLEKIEDPANEKEPSAKGNSDYSQVAIVNKCDERSDSVPVAVSGTDVAEGEQFFDWLREGLNRGDISFNGKADKIHVIAGYVFLPVPGIFSTTLRPLVRLFNGKAFRLLLSDLTCISVVITGDFILLSFTIHPTSPGGSNG